MKKFLVVLSLICANSHATNSLATLPSQVSNGVSTFMSSCVQAAKSVLTDPVQRSYAALVGTNVAVGSGLYYFLRSSVKDSYKLQDGLMRKMADYEKAGIITKEFIEYVKNEINDARMSFDRSSKYAYMAGLMFVIALREKEFPVILGAGVSTLIKYFILLNCDKKMKLANHCLNNPTLDVKDYAKKEMIRILSI